MASRLRALSPAGSPSMEGVVCSRDAILLTEGRKGRFQVHVFSELFCFPSSHLVYGSWKDMVFGRVYVSVYVV